MTTKDWNAAAFGQRLRAARKARGLSIDVVGEHFDVSRATVGHWETGRSAVTHEQLARLCLLLNTSADELMFGTRRWLFPKIDYDSVAELERDDLLRLEGALILAAAQMEIEIKVLAA